jgi:16S rRNA (guanine966-N2)-methyltransferase
VRVITGRLKGAQFDSPHNKRTHPMSDRVRGALFNALGDLSGLTVLDAYGGTGALSFEAVSRGAASVVICEIDKPAQKIIDANIAKLGLSNVTLHHGNAKSWLRRNKSIAFDVVLLDPPYDDIDPALLQLALDRLKPSGIAVVSWPGKAEVRNFSGVELVQQSKYGDAQLLFLRAS